MVTFLLFLGNLTLCSRLMSQAHIISLLSIVFFFGAMDLSLLSRLIFASSTVSTKRQVRGIR